MRVLLVLIVLALAAGAAYQFYFKTHPLSFLQGPEAAAKKDAAAVAKKDFRDLSNLLQGDMDHIPHDLREARQMPNHAYDVKGRIAPYLDLHEEYRTVTQVCDAIIGADQDFGERQGKCGLAKPGLGSPAQERARAAAGVNTEAYKQQEPLWDSRRRQIDSEVRAKLTTLENRRL